MIKRQPRVRFSAFPIIYFDAVEIYRWRLLEERGQWVDNVDLTHQVIASLLALQRAIASDTVHVLST